MGKCCTCGGKTDNPRCKKCAKEYAAAYRKTKIGVVTEIYSDQRKNSKRRGHFELW
jgi:hypothetical protein